MSTPAGLREITDADLDQALESLLAPRLSELIGRRSPGHCMRLNDFPAPLCERLTRRLRALLGERAQIHVLGSLPLIAPDVALTSTKLVELRNPTGEGLLRPPLLVFVPPATQASAEDSFGTATFEEISFPHCYQELGDRLLAQIPAVLGASVVEALECLRDIAHPATDDDVARARFLLTLTRNDNDSEAAGAALHELGLIPDFEVFLDRARLRTRLVENVRQVQFLSRPEGTVRERVVRLRLRDRDFRIRLANYLVSTGLDNVRVWTRRIVTDPANWPLSFHRWPLPDSGPTETVHLLVSPLNLPLVGENPDDLQDPVLRTIPGQPFLRVSSRGAVLPMSFEVRPDPRQLEGLQRFSVELLHEDSGPTGVTTYAKVASTAKTRYKASLRKLKSSELEPGWHYVRVLPLNSDGLPLPLANHTAASGHPSNESERFFILTGEDITDDITDSSVRRNAVGVTQEMRRLGLVASGISTVPALTSVVWGPGSKTLEASFGTRAKANIPVSALLVAAEQAILASPEKIAPVRVTTSIASPATLHPRAEVSEVSISRAIDGFPDRTDFFQARKVALEAIRGDSNMVVAGRDVLTLAEPILRYAEMYAELLGLLLQRAERPAQRAECLRALAVLLQLDTVAIQHDSRRGPPAEITAVAPTHPLRLLWLLTWAELAREWADTSEGFTSEQVASLMDSLTDLTPSLFPLVVTGEAGRLRLPVAGLGPGWQAYIPSEAPDPRRLLDEVAASLGLASRAAEPGDGQVSVGRLADCLERYVRLHPYVRTLVLCVVNAGHAAQLADLLLELQRRPGTRQLSYDIRLFTADPEASGTGRALADLLNGRWRDTNEAEVFHTPTSGTRAAKLSVAIHRLSEFRQSTSRHNAHLTMLFDALSPESVEVGPAVAAGPAPVHGLIQAMDVQYVEEGEEIAWHRSPRHGARADSPEADEPGGLEVAAQLLQSLPALISQCAAAVSTGETGTHQVPSTTLRLSATDQALLHQAHRCSDWVITVDRSLGVEYFDNPTSLRRPDYIIDFASTGSLGAGHQVVVSSRSVDEIHALLAPVLGQHGIDVDRRHAATFFDQLRLLSGRLAFKIASTAATQRTEILGLALARLYLQYQGALTDQILVPLDSHLELYRDARRRAESVSDSVSLQRTDLALFSLNARERLITCRLVEVKCFTSTSGLGDVQRTRARIAGQLGTSDEVLSDNFDPYLHSPDHPDRSIRNARLGQLLGFHLDRAVRHQIMQSDAATEGRWLLDRLDEGYRWTVTRTGLVFDLSGQGLHRDAENGVDYHTIGRDIVNDLLESLSSDPVLAAGHETSGSWNSLMRAAPRLADAQFLEPDRDHSVPEERGHSVGRPFDPGTRPDESAESPRHEPDTAGDQTAVTNEATPPEGVIADLEAPPGPTRDLEESPLHPDVFVGASHPTPQFGVLGEAVGRIVALDLNETHAISLFGVQGGGKSYTLGSIIEAASLPTPPANHLPQPLATIVFHYSPTADYAPEFTSMVAPNDHPEQVQRLAERYGVRPTALTDVVLLAPEAQVAQRRIEFPGIEIRPLAFAATELQARHWRFLMGAIGNRATYVQQLNRIMRNIRNNLTLDGLRAAIDTSTMSDSIKALAHQRLDLAGDYIDDSVDLRALVRPGRMIIVDLRDDLIEKDEALGLFVVLMELFAAANGDGVPFNKLVVFDEAHKYIESPDLVGSLVESVREMRHKGMTILVASQDPPSIPQDVIELSDLIILHRFNSPAWLKHLQKANTALLDLTPSKMSSLTPGDAYIWAAKSTDPTFTRGTVKVSLRPRITKHGGDTRTAVN